MWTLKLISFSIENFSNFNFNENYIEIVCALLEGKVVEYLQGIEKSSGNMIFGCKKSFLTIPTQNDLINI